MAAKKLTFEELLLALQALIGRDVLVTARSPNAGPTPVISIIGKLQRAEAAPSLEVLKELGRASPSDESLIFRVGGEDPDDQNYFVVTRSTFEEAGRITGSPDASLYFVVSDVSFTVVDRAKAEKSLGRD